MDDVNLNLDILHRVMALSTQCTVSHVMRTCHALNHEGARHILSQDPSLDTLHEAKSFLRFMRARRNGTVTANRLAWLEGLQISSFDLDEENAFANTLKRFFIHFAPRAPRFTRLSIDQGEDESIFSADPELPLAISALTTLRYLRLMQAGDHSMNMLRCLQSSLFHVEIAFDTARCGDVEDEDPVAALTKSTNTLCTLSIRYAAVASSPTPPCYAHLHQLSLSYVELPTTWHLIQAFPSLRTLTTSDTALRVHFGDLNETQDAARRRQRLNNIGDQQRYGSWRFLESYKGSLSMLFVLGLSCQTSHVDVGNAREEDETFDLDMLYAVVVDTRPKDLTLRIDFPSHLASSGFEDGLFSLCSAQAFQTVEMCKVCIDMFPGDAACDVGALLVSPAFLWWQVFQTIDPSSFQDALCEGMAASGLNTFKLLIDWRLLASPPFRIPKRPRRQRGEPDPPSPALAYLEALDVEELAYRFLDAITSITTVKVSLIRSHTDRQTVTLERETSDCSSGHDALEFAEDGKPNGLQDDDDEGSDSDA